MESTNGSGIVAEVKIYLKGNSWLRYILTERKITDELGDDRDSYSIILEGEIDEEHEYAVLEDVYSDRCEAMSILMVFAENTVTPESAEYIMEDILAGIE